MGFRFRKSIKLGLARINLSKSGIGFSVGAGGLRYTKSPNRKKSKKGTNGLLDFFKALFMLGSLAVVISFIFEYKTVFLILAVVAAIIGIAVAIYLRNKTQNQVSDSDT